MIVARLDDCYGHRLRGPVPQANEKRILFVCHGRDRLHVHALGETRRLNHHCLVRPAVKALFDTATPNGYANERRVRT